MTMIIPACGSPVGTADETGPVFPEPPNGVLDADGLPIRYGYVLPENREPILAELADTPARQVRGFMFREVGPDDAMLFLFPVASFHSIWMKNCLVPLDVIWLREDGTVVHLEENLQPCAAQGPCPGVGPMQQARYVLELAGGQARRRGLTPGARVELILPN
jgi:uncharacterized membrane protein (UPF0127 family)